MKKQMAATYGVIGLGRFGTALATTLAKAGKEVIVIDRIESKVKEMRQYTDYAFVVDELSEQAMRETGIQNCDVVIVCIGEKVDVSILTTMSAGYREMRAVRPLATGERPACAAPTGPAPAPSA